MPGTLEVPPKHDILSSQREITKYRQNVWNFGGEQGPQSTIMIYNTSYLAVLGQKCVQKGHELIRNLGAMLS